MACVRCLIKEAELRADAFDYSDLVHEHFVCPDFDVLPLTEI
jgi:hypothetical protein